MARLFELEFQSAELPHDLRARPVVARLPIEELLDPDTGPVALGSAASVPVVVDAELPESPPPPHAERRVRALNAVARPVWVRVVRFIVSSANVNLLSTYSEDQRGCVTSKSDPLFCKSTEGAAPWNERTVLILAPKMSQFEINDEVLAVLGR